MLSGFGKQHQILSFAEEGCGVFFTFSFVVYLQLQDPECLTSSRTPIEHAACFMAHSLGYVVLSLAHTASSVRLSGQVSSHSEQRPRLIRASQRHFFPALHWMSSHDLASRSREEQQSASGKSFLKGISMNAFQAASYDC